MNGRWMMGRLVAASGLVALAGFAAIAQSRFYYLTAPYHYDSAAYRVQAFEAHDMFRAEGWRAAVGHALASKDGLDILLRVALAPSTLLQCYGHLAVLLPLMVFFTALAIEYGRRRTGSWLLALLAPATLFVYPLIYSPYWGIADYWKDNLAAWLLGSASIAWLLAANLQARCWAFCSGLLLGLLAMQRTAAAMYAAMVFLPLFGWAFYQVQARLGFRLAAARAAWFVMPAGLLAGVVLFIQGRELAAYYLGRGYSYGTAGEVARFLLSGVSRRLAQPPHDYFPGTDYGVSFIPIVLLPAYWVAWVSAGRRGLRSSDFIQAFWLVVGLPLCVIAALGYYYGFFALWPPLLVVFLLASYPEGNCSVPRVGLVLILALGILSGAALQQYRCQRVAARMAEQGRSYRTLLLDLARRIAPPGRPVAPYATFFNETGAPLANQAFFDLGVRVGPPAVFITFHDAYFRSKYPHLTPAQIVQAEMRRLENMTNAVAVGHADLRDLYHPPDDPLAYEVIRGFNTYLLGSPHWRAEARLPSPWGPLIVFRLSCRDADQ